jgi:hypothetical protein
MIIAVDFDGTIAEHEYPNIGSIKKGAKETINKWYDAGHKIIIWTCRGGKEAKEASQFLKENGIKFHTINENADPSDDFNPYPKVFAHLYIDDRGFRFTDDHYNWEYLSTKI